MYAYNVPSTTLGNLLAYFGLIMALQSISVHSWFTDEENETWLMLSNTVWVSNICVIKYCVHCTTFFFRPFCFHTSFLKKYTKLIMIEDNKENKDHSFERGRATLIFSLKNEVGGLMKALKIFQVNTLHIFA